MLNASGSGSGKVSHISNTSKTLGKNWIVIKFFDSSRTMHASEAWILRVISIRMKDTYFPSFKKQVMVYLPGMKCFLSFFILPIVTTIKRVDINKICLVCLKEAQLLFSIQIQIGISIKSW